MKKLLTALACVAAIALCVFLGSLLGSAMAGKANSEAASSGASATAGTAASAAGSSQSGSGPQVIGFALAPPEGFENTTEPDMNAAYLHADSSEVLLKTYDIANFEGGMGAMTQEQMLQILAAGYKAEYGLDPDYTVNSYEEKGAGTCPGYLLDVTVKTHRGKEEYQQLLYAAETQTGTMYLWSFTDESGTGAHMEDFRSCIDAVELVTSAS
jgi:hypothetical protein